ncbi:MAG TPA: hypothetical protein VIH76_14215 [Candidatus Acidoferrales bacterium]
MPMIRGRYYMNPTVGAAIENTRALGNVSQLGDGPSDPFTDDGAGDSNGHGTYDSPATAIHRVEIDISAAPNGARSGGRNARGYVAHIHREVIDAAPAGANSVRSAFGVPSETPGIAARSGSSDEPGFVPRGVFAPAPETHIFTTAGDLVSFLRDTLAEE